MGLLQVSPWASGLGAQHAARENRTRMVRQHALLHIAHPAGGHPRKTPREADQANLFMDTIFPFIFTYLPPRGPTYTTAIRPLINMRCLEGCKPPDMIGRV